MPPTEPAAALRDIRELLPAAVAFKDALARARAAVEPDSGFWYPYDIFANLWHLEDMLVGEHRDLAAMIGNRRVADVGAADGDLSFFLASLGVGCDAYDNAPSNFNHLQGARRLQQHLGTDVTIEDLDLDTALRLPRSGYGLTFFLGILYHLKNPFGVLEGLSRQTEYCFLSTRVARKGPDKTTQLAPMPLGYLVGPEECNGDASNYWVFTPEGLLRLVERTGWEVLGRLHRGELDDSDPASSEGDERAFLLLRSLAHD